MPCFQELFLDLLHIAVIPPRNAIKINFVEDSRAKIQVFQNLQKLVAPDRKLVKKMEDQRKCILLKKYVSQKSLTTTKHKPKNMPSILAWMKHVLIKKKQLSLKCSRMVDCLKIIFKNILLVYKIFLKHVSS